MTTQQDSYAQFSRYTAELLNYLRTEHLDNPEELGGKEWAEIARDLGQIAGLQYVPEELQRFYTPEYQEKLRSYVESSGGSITYFPTLDAAAPAEPAEAPEPAEPVEPVEEEPNDG